MSRAAETHLPGFRCGRSVQPGREGGEGSVVGVLGVGSSVAGEEAEKVGWRPLSATQNGSSLSRSPWESVNICEVLRGLSRLVWLGGLVQGP